MRSTAETGYAGKTALVVGAGMSGIAASKFLLSHGAAVVLTDAQEDNKLAATIAPLRAAAQRSGGLVFELGGHKAESFRKCDFVVVSPGVPLSLPFFAESRKAGIPIIAEVELAFRHIRGKIVAITGSNGKTTTTALVTELLLGTGLKARSAGNIGAPLIGMVEESSHESVFATELSSFQLEGILQFRPYVGSILNVTPDHMDRYAGMEAYFAAKKRIFMNQKATDFAVLNRDDTRTAALATEVPSRPFLFSRRTRPESGAFVREGNLYYCDDFGETMLCARDEILLKGEHNLENVLAACAIAILAGASPRIARDVIRSFRGVEHRLEWVAEIDGVQYYNDSKATNIDAAIRSLESFPGNILLIAGGRDKEGDFTSLQPAVEQRVKHLVVLGEAAGKIRETLMGAVDISEAGSLPEAVRLCRYYARPGDVILLAPACASFDMFQNFEHRGRVFKQAVHDMKSGG